MTRRGPVPVVRQDGAFRYTDEGNRLRDLEEEARFRRGGRGPGIPVRKKDPPLGLVPRRPGRSGPFRVTADPLQSPRRVLESTCACTDQREPGAGGSTTEDLRVEEFLHQALAVREDRAP